MTDTVSNLRFEGIEMQDFIGTSTVIKTGHDTYSNVKFNRYSNARFDRQMPDVIGTVVQDFRYSNGIFDRQSNIRFDSYNFVQFDKYINARFDRYNPRAERGAFEVHLRSLGL